MRSPLVLLSSILILAAVAPSQANCNGWTPGAPAFAVDCPCGSGYPLLYFTGTARIGTVQRITPYSTPAVFLPIAFLVIGTPAVAPTPLPQGLVACAANMAPVPSLGIDPIEMDVIMFAWNTSTSNGPTPMAAPHYLFIPNLPAIVGVTVNCQYFEQMWGTGSVPFAASPVIGFTIAP